MVKHTDQGKKKENHNNDKDEENTTWTMLRTRTGARIRTQHYKDNAMDKDRSQDPDTALQGQC